MKKIWNIAKNELYSLFYSPIAWIIFMIFMVMISASYIRGLESFFRFQRQGGWGLSLIKHLTFDITVNPKAGYFMWELGSLYIFFPLLTMGLISREKSNGTIKLLYSSPVRIRDIVLGKYLAILVITLCFVAICAITMVALSFCVVQPDYLLMLGTLGGLFLLLATYAAIGLFFSSLTTYQIVAALITFACLAFLTKAGELWQEVDIVRGITYYLNIGSKTGYLMRGLYNLRDICYFLIIITCFLCFTIFRTRAFTESVSRWKTASRYIAVIAMAAIVGYVTSRPSVNIYSDLTRDQMHTITKPTREVLAKLNEGPLEITLYANLLDNMFVHGFKPSQQNETMTYLLEPYIRFKPDIKVNFVYYYALDTASYYFKNFPGMTLRQIAEKQAAGMRVNFKKFLSPEEVKKLADIEAEELRHFFVIKYKDRSVVVRTFPKDNDIWPSENEITAGLKSMIMDRPKIAFLADGIARGPFSDRQRDYKFIAASKIDRESLLNQGYLFDTVKLEGRQLPDHLAGLVIADVRKPLSDDCLEKISQYIDRGGNLYLAVEPDRKELVAPLLQKLGLQFRKGMLIQPHTNNSSDLVYAELTPKAQQLSPQFERFLYDEHRFSGDSVFRIALGGSGSFDYVQKDGFLVEPLLKTNPQLIWNRIRPVSADSLQLKLSRLSEDESSSFLPALKLTRMLNGKEQRIFVAADADYLSESYLIGRNPVRYNYGFGFWCFSQFSYGRYPANTVRPFGKDVTFKIQASAIPWQKKILYWIIPAIIGLAGSALLIRRKRK
ncbi:MAG: Gldg family protein [Chitinophagaceae bacterium]|nr:Gldg family protein [Chitinophagaceae bacterium]